LLEGTQKWIDDPTLGDISYDRGQNQSPFVRVANNSLPSRMVDRQRVRAVLNTHCGPGSFLRALYCLSLVTPIWVLYSKADQRIPLIEHVLELFSCPSSGSKSDLAVALANI
jgi:hypothetical protein